MNRFRRFPFALACLAALFLAAPVRGAEKSAPVFPAGLPPPPQAPRVVPSPYKDREIDPIVLRGAALKDFLGRPIADLRLYVSDGEKLLPVPYQIDERYNSDQTFFSPHKEKGNYVLTGGKHKGEDDDKGIFDDNDELVFMARDVGVKYRGEISFENLLKHRELALGDGLDGTVGYVYLLAFSENPPARSPVDYVVYDPETDVSVTPNYAMGFHPDYRFAIDRMSIPTQDGWAEDNVDILKIRMKAEVLGISIERTQEDFNSEIGGWLDGPIRIIKWASMSVRVVLFLHSPRIWNYTYFYPNAFSYDMEIKTPIKISSVVKNMHLHSGMDFRDAYGAELYSSGFGAPYVVRQEPDQKTLDKINSDPDRNDFFAVKYLHSYWLARILIPSDVSLVPDVLVTHDARLADPPEAFLGSVPGIYFRLKNWEQLESKHFTIRSFVIVTDTFVPGEESTFFKRQDTPIELIAQ